MKLVGRARNLAVSAVATLPTIVAGCSPGTHVSPTQRPRTTARADFRPAPWEPFSPEVDVPGRDLVRTVLCHDATARCEAACADASDEAAYAKCAIALRYREDHEGLTLARALLAQMGTVPGLETRTAIDAAYLGDLPVEPAIPVGPYRYHLRWILSSLVEFEELFSKVTPSATSPVLFRTRPNAFRFFRTAQPSFPSAYASLTGDGSVAYNVLGVLYKSRDDVAATLFHELFHLNDHGHGAWSEHALVPVFEAIRERCGTDHDCFGPYAADDTVVPGGTYYAFDSRTGHVREYAAEVALRWFREHRAVVLEGRAPGRAFKCLTEENRVAWELMTAEFFGGIDRVAACEH